LDRAATARTVSHPKAGSAGKVGLFCPLKLYNRDGAIEQARRSGLPIRRSKA